VRLVVYNMRYGAGAGWRFNLPYPGAGYLRDASGNVARIGDYLQGLGPDLVALLEVDGGSHRAPQPQHHALADRLGHQHGFRCKYREGSLLGRLPLLRTQGNAVLSRLPLHGLRFHELAWGSKSLVIEAEHESLSLFVVHLALRPHHRRRQLHELADLVRAAAKPAVVAGDLNTLAPGRELAPFLAATGLRPADHHLSASWPSHRPRLALDHVLVAPELGVRAVAVPDVRYSDHRPLVCDLKLH
jgi:endonuclease/exonuclease/phosphatase family metal-dependent hydrolase